MSFRWHEPEPVGPAFQHLWSQQPPSPRITTTGAWGPSSLCWWWPDPWSEETLTGLRTKSWCARCEISMSPRSWLTTCQCSWAWSGTCSLPWMSLGGEISTSKPWLGRRWWSWNSRLRTTLCSRYMGFFLPPEICFLILFFDNGLHFVLNPKGCSQCTDIHRLCKNSVDFTSSLQGLPWWLRGKESAYDARDAGLIPGSGRSPGRGNRNSLQHSCLRNPLDRGAWRTTVHGISKSWTWLSN